MVVLLAKAIEAKDNYTGNHCERVRDYAMLLGESYGLSSEDLIELKFGATLHDIGKLGISEDVLNKPGLFTQEEFEIIKSHSQIGFDIMEEMPMMVKAKQIILHHHERFDGYGYPYGLKGEEIPLLARIVSIADAFDAMTSLRPYRKNCMTKREGFDELRRHSGTQFDPEMIELFIEQVKISSVKN
jgi:putative nucleotidyltransferase with HDIG domain